MAVFEMNDEETWLPTFAQGKGVKVQKVRLHHQDGSRGEYTVPTASPREITVTDARAIRHLESDPRFTRVS